MFKDKTVLVLGAGSSAEFGLPTGRDIINHISIPYQTRNMIPKPNPTGYTALGAHFVDFYEELFGGEQELKELLNLGQKGYHKSIDLLAVRNPKLLEQTKLLSAWCIFSKIYQPTTNFTPAAFSNGAVLPSFSWREKSVKSKANWIGAIAEKILSAGTSEEKILQNQLSVVSFNYDTIFEDALNHFLRQDEIFSDLSKECTPEIIQVFGSFSEIPEKMYRSDIKKMAQKIEFMGELDRDSNMAVGRAKELISNAEKVFLVGFDCHSENCDLIGLNDAQADIYALNYDGNQSLQRKLTGDLELPEKHIFSGTSAKPVGVSEAFANEFLNYADWYSDRDPFFGFVA